MNVTDLETAIEAAWEDRASLSPQTKGSQREAIEAAIMGLDSGKFRVAARQEDGEWVVHQWLKKAVLLGFRLEANVIMSGGPAGGNWFDKVPSKFATWTDEDFAKAGIRAVPPAAVRRGAFIAPNTVLMPSYVNLGAYVGEGTMIDTWASVGSCAQVGKDCHISAGTGIGGVLEPLQANPTIIEDNCFIGARSEVVEGVIVLPGTLPAKDGSHSLDCAVIVKTVDARTRSKTGVNELLRD